MLRRSLLQTLAAMPLAASSASAQALARQRRYDILVRNGEVLDPGRRFRQRADVGISDGMIAAVEPSIPIDRGMDIIDATGLYVTPGLVDLHTHCYRLETDKLAVNSGTTTWVDAGSFGSDQAAGFRRFVVRPQQARIFGYIHQYPNLRNPDVDPIKYARGEVRGTGETAVANRDIILGIKVYVGSNMNGRYGLDFLKVGRELGDKYKLPLMVHISFSPPETHEVMELLRGGDIVTHCYNTHTLGILDKTDRRNSVFSSTGKLKPGVKEARERGVLFDIGHGSGSFNFKVARCALDAGFPPDTISTDIYGANIDGPVFDLPTTMSKMLHLGMSFEDVLLRATANPAKIVNRVPGLGSLEVGAPADLALLALEEGSFRLIDAQKDVVTAAKRIVSRLTICRGKRLVAPV